MSLGKWLRGKPDLGPFSFGTAGGSFPGGAAHTTHGELVFCAPGRLEPGLLAGPPTLDPESWNVSARRQQAQLERVTGGAEHG